MCCAPTSPAMGAPGRPEYSPCTARRRAGIRAFSGRLPAASATPPISRHCPAAGRRRPSVARRCSKGRISMEELQPYLRGRLIPLSGCTRPARWVKGVTLFASIAWSAISSKLATRYRDAGADELVFYDITASPEGRSVAARLGQAAWRRYSTFRSASPAVIPLGGRCRSGAERRRREGFGKFRRRWARPAADRRTGPPALAPSAWWSGVDSQTTARRLSRLAVHGRSRPQAATLNAIHCCGYERCRIAAPARDRAELHGLRTVLRDGYDIRQLQAVRAACQVPLGRVRGRRHARSTFARVFDESRRGCGRWLPAFFHSGQIAIPDLKRFLLTAGIRVRP